jgi:hypothetical protein
MTFTLAELRACAEREVRWRKTVYPNRVLTGRLSKYAAARELAMMEAIRERLREAEEAERLV